MKKFVAIGHWEGNDNITSIASDASTMKDFRADCKGNGFIAYVILTEKKLAECKAAEGSFEVFEIIKKLTSNYRKWSDCADYIKECMDIIESRLAAI